MAVNHRGKGATQSPPTEEQHTPNRPAHEVRLGRVKAAVWGNQTENGVRYSVTMCRVYKDQQGKWQTADGFGRDDLLLLAKVADLAHSWICEATSSDAPF